MAPVRRADSALLSRAFSLGRKERLDPENPSTAEPAPLATPSCVAKVSEQAILDIVLAHEHSGASKDSNETATLPKRPKFDSLEQYDVTEAQERELWKWEVSRLLRVVTDPPAMLAFEDTATLRLADPYRHFSSLAESILLYLHVCTLDNELVLLTSPGSELHHDKKMTESERAVEKWLGNTDSDIRAILAKALASKSPPEDPTDLETVVTFAASVDYVTAVVAHVALSSADDERWQSRVLAGLAKCAAKLKILRRRPKGYAARSLRAKEDLLVKQRGQDLIKSSISAALRDGPTARAGWSSYHFDERAGITAGSQQTVTWTTSQMDALVRSESDSDLYFADMAFTFRWTFEMLATLLGPLIVAPADAFSNKTTNKTPLPNVFDISTVTYRAGVGDYTFPIYVHQDRSKALQGCSYNNFVKHAYPGFLTMKHALLAMKSHRSTEGKAAEAEKKPSLSRDSASFVMFRMDSPPIPNKERAAGRKDPTTGDESLVDPGPHWELTTSAEIFAALIPLLCTAPNVIQALQFTLSKFGQLHSIGMEKLAPPPSANDFSGMISVYTQEFRAKSHSELPGDAVDYDSLSLSVLAHPNRLIEHRKVPAGTVAWSSDRSSDIKLGLEEAQQRRKQLGEEMRNWDIEESTISVKCNRYVYTVLGCAGFLVVLGLVAAFTIGDKLDGVDPFNIANFTWLLAAFAILIAKSVRVTEWPWRDFLLGRVTCRSLSELRDVTSANEQDLILCLLGQENETALTTKGPHNRMFKSSSSSGFAIDIKPQLRTLVSAGLVLVRAGPNFKDESPIECFDFRQFQDSEAVVKFSESDRKFICRKPPKKGDRIQDVIFDRGYARESEPAHVGQTVVSFRSNNILGIYRHVDKAVRW